MKALTWALVIVASATIWTSCQKANARYIDLATGEQVTLERDDENGEMINVQTGEPVRLYVNTKTKDTIFGPSGKIVNNEVIRLNDMYVYAGDEEYKSQLEKDGDYEAKYGDEYKVKSDADGSYKVKRGDDYKKEVEKDGDVTIKKGDVKIKIDGETGEQEVKVDD